LWTSTGLGWRVAFRAVPRATPYSNKPSTTNWLHPRPWHAKHVSAAAVVLVSPHLWATQDTNIAGGLCACPYERWPRKWPTRASAGPYLPRSHAMPGPRSVCSTMIHPQELGCTHFIIGPRHGRLQIIA